MTRFLTLVIVPKGAEDVERAVSDLLRPYDNAYKGPSPHAGKARWDWWMIGGTYTGAFDGYKPQQDPANLQKCVVCEGRGQRWSVPDPVIDPVLVKCRTCDGTGNFVKWPINWRHHPGDITAVKNILGKVRPAAIVTPDGVWHESFEGMGKPGLEWPEIVDRLLLARADELVVAVDCHV